jgi:CelD/BcsL family acetyltransferase involved in cellulose biosynthesis
MAGACVEIVELDRVDAYEEAWRNLGARALEINVFAEFAYVVAALRYFANARRLRLLFVWQDESRQHLNGVMVLELPRIAFDFGVAKVWQSNQAGLAALMLDREVAADTLAILLDWLARQRPSIAGLLLPTCNASGATSLALAALASGSRLRHYRFGARSRAILIVAASLARGFEATLPKKRLKEWSRQMRRLKERGEVRFRFASDQAAIESFLALEAKGWKGAQHTALGADAGLAAFTRSMLARLASEGTLVIHLLELGEQVLAAGVVLRSGRRAFYWKTAYEESYAEYSPGVQLTLEMSRMQQRDATIAATDSCAIEGHPMIDRLWTARLALVDCLIATRPGPARGLTFWLMKETARRRLREWAKRVLNPLRQRKIS